MGILRENIESRNLGRIMDQDESAKRKVLTEAWNKSGFLTGLSGREASNMAVMLENQKRQNLKESTSTADMAIFDTIAIPMIRRQHQAMITPLIVSVQPLTQPHGVVFFMDYKISDTKLPIRSDYLGRQNVLTATGVDNQGFNHMDGNTFDPTSVYDRYYNNKNYDQTKGKAINRGWNPATNALWVNETSNVSVFSAQASLSGVNEPQRTAVVEFDLSSIGGLKMDALASLEVYDATGVLKPGVDFIWQRVAQNWGVEFGSSEYVTVADQTTSTMGTLGGPGSHNMKLRLQIVPTKPNLGDVELRLGFKQYLNLELFPAFSAEMKMVINRQTIDTQIHKLKTAWTVEFAQDLMSYYAIDAETELTQALAEEIAQEKDRMVISELAAGAAHLEIWDADFKNAIDPSPATTVFRGLEGDYNQSLIYAINAVDGKIRKSTKKGGANWVIISAEGFTKLRNMATFRVEEGKDDTAVEFAGGIEKVGTLEQRYAIYVDPNLPAHLCLVGRKGTSFFDTGYVYAPYIEYMLSEAVEDQDFNKRKMISSRFGTAMLNNKFYGVVYMQGITEYIPTQPELVNNTF